MPNKVARRAVRRANQTGASPREKKALVEAGIVESGLRHIPGGDRDSTGFLQQRPSQGWGSRGESVETDTDQFLAAARKINRAGFHGSAGQLAQAVQRSAFPGRYDEVGGRAAQILSSVGGSSATASADGSSSTTSTKTIPGVDRSDQRRALLLAYLGQRGAPDALLNLKSGLDQSQDTPDRKVSTVTHSKTQGASQAHASGHAGVASFEGKKVASWIAPLLEYARAHGWKGTVTSGVRTDAEQTRIYKSGVRPAAVPKSMGGAGSKHEQTGFLQGAIDVTDAGTLDTILKRKHSRLKFAGSKDPVHFSHPNPDGSY